MSPCDYAPNAQNKVGIIQKFSARIYIPIVKLDAGYDAMFCRYSKALGFAVLGSIHVENWAEDFFIIPTLCSLTLVSL